MSNFRNAINIDLEKKGYTIEEILRVGEFLLETFYEADNADNLRIARSWVPSEVAEFECKRNQGCCGSHEGGIVGSQGTVYIGYNYGH
jgi:hypothetical protein